MSTRPNTVFAHTLASLVLVGLLATACGSAPTAEPTLPPTRAATEEPEEVVLTMGSWRPDDIEQMNRILDEFHEGHPAIRIRFTPTNAPDYNQALEAQLEAGTAPDLFYLRSYATSRIQYEEGYLEPLDDLPGLKESFASEMLAPWATDDGLPYGVPFIATSHGIYYNEEIFSELGIAVPDTWEQLMTAAETIQEAGFIPFANTSGDPWTVAELVFMNLAPSFIGGRDGRMAYLNGDRCFDDSHVVAAFQAVQDLAPFLPENHELLTYGDSRELFAQGQAAMFMSGSWDIAFFVASGVDFDWSVFATPPPAGRSPHVTFHPDAGMGLNAASSHKEAARTFLTWMTTSECASALANELPGFFPMHRDPPAIANEQASTFLELNEGRGTDARFAWEKLRGGSPDGYVLMQDGALAVLQGQQTPQEAADALQAGLEQWFQPAQSCPQ